MNAPHRRYLIALSVAVILHAAILLGLLLTDGQWRLYTVPGLIFIMFILILLTKEKLDKHFFFFVLIAFVFSLITCGVGVNTGLLFGNYDYGKSLGPAIQNVPLALGLFWIIIIYTTGIFTEALYKKVEKKFPPDNLFPKTIQKFSIVIDGALIATFFGWILEPAAIKLGFWSWQTETTPFLFYITWFGLSALLLLSFELLKFKKENDFAVHLFIIQLLFFLAIRVLL